MIIGLCGENCAGKSVTAEYLMKKGFYFLSLSDAIREELKKEGKNISRENLIEKGNELRKNFGPGALGKRIVQMLQTDKNYCIDSIRNPAEVEELKKAGNFYLLHITADSEIRFIRMKERKREQDPQTLESFEYFEKLEMENEDKSKQNLKGTFSLAYKKIENNFSLDELHHKIDSVLSEIFEKVQFNRPSWDDYFMGIAKVVASRSNCIKRKVAAIIVKDKRIISTGYNGTPRGTKNCAEGGCPRCNSFTQSGKNLEECYCSHGEENAIVQASYHGICIKDSIIYSTFSPCLLCTKMIINAGIKEVIYNVDYPLGEVSLKLLNDAGVKSRQHKIE